MFDNTFVYLQTILDSKKESVQDNVGDPLQSREYNGLLAKFLEGIPDSFQVDSWLTTTVTRGDMFSSTPRGMMSRTAMTENLTLGAIPQNKYLIAEIIRSVLWLYL